MNQNTDADPGEAPDANDRRPGRRRIDSLPGPRPESFPAALAAPAPTMDTPSERTPAAEVSASPRHVYVTVELPGAPKDALDIQATSTELTVLAPRVGLPGYRLRITLPVAVDPESAKATYRNGILDVTLMRTTRAGGDAHDQ